MVRQQQEQQQKEQKKIPDVFYLKPLNNWNQQSKIMNNAVTSCQCYCQEKQELKPLKKDQWSKIKQKMVIRVKRTRLLMAAVGIICFAFGIAIPFIFHMGAKNDEKSHFHHSEFRVGHKSSHRIPPLMPPPLVTKLHKLKNNSLQDVFISVKTTKKYHYPRLIIQLETWVSLVKSQVSKFHLTLCAYIT